ITQMVVDSINCCDIELRSTMQENIILLGGTTITLGFEKRITHELSKHFDCKIKASDNRNHLAFVCGTILISHISTENIWISKKRLR
ncbi:unnamed protein product, partial [Rotaria magnacalcarata]